MEDAKGDTNISDQDSHPLKLFPQPDKDETVDPISRHETTAHRVPVNYQDCMLPSFSCYLEEAEAFNQHLTDLARHTAR